jgi:predicted ferric reductase
MSGASVAVLAATKVWWYVSRSSGIVAWVLAVAAVLWGVALSTRALGRRPPAPWLLDVHRFLGGLTVVFVVVHLVGLVLDPWVSFGLTDLLVPGAASWSPAAVAWGVVALYLLVAVEATSLLRNRIPKRLWRGVHLTSYATYALATVHLLTAGTDRHAPVPVGAVVVSVGLVAFFTVYRLVGPGRAASVRGAGGAAGPRRSVPPGEAPSGGRAGSQWSGHVPERDRPLRRRGGDTGGAHPGERSGVAVWGQARGRQHK